MEGSLPRPARSRPLEQPTAPPARRRDDAKRLPVVLALLAALAMTFVLTENRRIARSHFEGRTRRGTDDLRFLIDPVKEMVAKGIETATTGAGWLKGGPQMVSDVVCGVVDTWVSVIDPNEGTIRKAMSGDAATLDELASLASTIGSIVFVVYVCMTAVNLFLATAESVRDYFKNYLTIPKLSKAVPIVGQYLTAADGPWATVTAPIQKYILDPVKNWKHRTILPFEGSHGSTLSGTIATITAATSACLLLSTTPDVLALARGGANKAAAEALAWTVGTALGLKYVAARA